jgi:hypothetical protein
MDKRSFENADDSGFLVESNWYQKGYNHRSAERPYSLLCLKGGFAPSEADILIWRLHILSDASIYANKRGY